MSYAVQAGTNKLQLIENTYILYTSEILGSSLGLHACYIYIVYD